jgi:hypothetical protein
MSSRSDVVGRIVGLGARVHLFVRPESSRRFRWLFEEVLLCSVVERDFGLDHPIMLVTFPDGSAFSAEFTQLAPAEPASLEVADQDAFRGAWMEFRTDDLAQFLDRLRKADIPEFKHPGSQHSYFIAPGGQVFRLLDVDYQGP